MGYRTASTRRSTAASAVSSQAVIVNTGNTAPAGSSPSFSAVGSTIAANTSISLGVTTVGQTSAATVTTVSAGPSITNIQYLDTNNAVIVGDVAVSTAGGNILINGTGFVANSNVYVNNTLVSNTFISSTQIRAILPAASSGNVSLMIFTPTNVGGIKTNGIRYSGVPSWTTSAVSFQNASAANVALVASSDSTLTYTLQAGSTLPTGISLNSAGYLAGTATGYSTNTSSTVVIIATDLEGQATQQTVSITVTVLDPQFPYTTLLLSGETSTTPFISDSSTNSFALTVAGDSKANKFSPYNGDGYYSNYLSSTSTGFTNASVTHGLAGNFTIEFWHYPTVTMTSGTYYYMAGASTGPLIAMNGGVVSFAHQGGFSVNGSAGVVQGQWNHIACVRSGTTVTVYLNGVSVGSGTDATNFSTAQTYGYGVANNGTSGTAGYISNFRITDGQALYTGTFTPSTAPLTTTSVGATGANVAASLTGTVTFLGFQSNRFIDKSSTNTALTLAGTPQVSPNIPFAASSTYSTYGSAYFDGTGDYLTTPASSITTLLGQNGIKNNSTFTIEAWIYQTQRQTYTSFPCLVGDMSPTAATNYCSFGPTSTGLLQLFWYDGANKTATGATVIPLNTWTHIAVSVSAGAIKLFVNGNLETITGTSTLTNATGTIGYLTLGQEAGGTSTNGYFGYVSDFRVLTTANYSATFTPPTAPLSAVANTQLLTCQYNGGANNYGIIDNGPFNNVITRAGNATQGTFSPYSQTGWSNYFNGSTDYLTVPATSTAFLTNPWTIECWVYVTTLAAAVVVFDTRNSGAGNNGVQCSIGTTGAITWFEGSGTSVIVTSTATITTNTWYHIAMVRSGTGASQCALYVNGVSKGTGTSSLSHAGYTTYIGRNAAAAQDYMPGYISNLRIVNGSAVYASAFTPSTTPLTAITNTSILTCQSNRFKDNSANNSTITLAGTPSIQAISPFSPGVSYTPSLHGGSCYFDGSGDYLTAPASSTLSLGAGDFTIEAWFYISGTQTQTYGHSIAGTYDAGTNGGWGIVANRSTDSRAIAFVLANAWQLSYYPSAYLATNQWYHVAVARSGSTMTMYLNGTSVASATYATADAVSATCYIGSQGASSCYFPGYISGVRLVKGTAVYTTAFTPPTAPTTSPTTTPATLLCNFTNGGIVDQHSTNVFESVAGVQVSTATKKYGSASMFFPNTASNALQFPASNQATAFGTGDFTVECWVYFATNNGTYNPFVRYDGSGTFDFGYDFSTTQLKYSGSAAILAVAQTFTVGTWYHVAVSRASGSSRLFVNGTQVGTTATGDTNNYASGAFKVGGSSYSTGHIMSGYIDDLRVTKGFARYTANFTAPTSAFLGQ